LTALKEKFKVFPQQTFINELKTNEKKIKKTKKIKIKANLRNLCRKVSPIFSPIWGRYVLRI
jgi:hypothetical protein